ncbi:uncharacterized protein LTR77_000201 [Saxophila tyrrhenica]|uniref:Mus7/MMS22 family-domain-containing protein n=1 Tax=Saxophila tyrrhenica TaxID=1690608 RepID=A0AAV9PMC1_9PEZI|nr:hypothetical protein LTR77_000201 [Saxophila tyrrhenica]
MKRWQDRGEVQDSDDEDLSLEAESQETEHVRKKPRLEADTGRSTTTQPGQNQPIALHGSHAPDEEEAEWLRPQVAAKYGRKAEVLRPSLDADGEKPPKRLDTDVETAACNSSQHSDRTQDQDIEQPKSSQSAESDELPNPSQLLRRPFVPAPAPDVVSPLSSAPSSPLSERDVSPPPAFCLQDAATGMADSTGTNQREVLELHDPISRPERMPSSALGRRSFRARNEKQLHPYMFELAQYQRQWRERGMRPIRYVENTPAREETQNTAGNGADSDSQDISAANSSSPVRLSLESAAEPQSSPVERPMNFSSDGEEELPDVQTLLRREDVTQRSNKRRKLLHIGIPASRKRVGREDDEDYDLFSVPPSPPPTSGRADHEPKVLPITAGFRIPRGMTPAPLPTPQVSSDTVERTISEPVDPSRADRTSTSRQQRRPVLVDSSSESSDAGTDSEVDELKLRRERKRIKGVLPASWLKIDLAAQQGHKGGSSVRHQSEQSTSPPKSIPRKGVAQTRQRFGTPARHGIIAISDDDGDDTSSQRDSPIQPRMRQSRLDFKREQTSTTMQAGTVDDERMEVDWVDPMFASTSRKHSDTTRRKRQPRITENFHREQRFADDFSEERKGLRAATGVGAGRTRRKRGTGPKRSKAPVQHHRLAIVDAQIDDYMSGKQLPSFLRLAMRTARQRRDNGRHSPTHKRIRLATREDTEDATATLRAWREGTIVPRSQGRASVSLHDDERVDVESGEDALYPATFRAPLAELANNSQSHLTEPPSKAEPDRHTKRRPVSTIRRPRTQQTRVTPTVTIQESTAQAGHPQAQPAPQDRVPQAKDRTTTARHNAPQAPHYSDAQLEMLESDFDQQHRMAAFERRMRTLTESARARTQRQSTAKDLPMTRFLHERPAGGARSPSSKHSEDTSGQPTVQVSIPHRPRKQVALRVDAEAREYRQPSEPLPAVINVDDSSNTVSTAVDNPTVLQGLGPFGTRYATDFDVLPLLPGTYFHQSSFIGSGDFEASLTFGERDLDVFAGRIRVHVDGEVLEWGAWTEEVSTGLTFVQRSIAEAVESLRNPPQLPVEGNDASVVLANVDYLLRSTVRFVARCVAFLDSIDRRACIQRLQSFVEDLLELDFESPPGHATTKEVASQCYQYAVVLAKQTTILGKDPLVQSPLVDRSNAILARASHQLGQQLVQHGLAELRLFLEDNRHAAKRDAGLRDSDAAVSGVVILYHVLRNVTAAVPTFWSVVYQALNVDVATLQTVSQLDTVWYNIFTLLPALEIGADGIAYPGSRMHGALEDWALPKHLMARVLELYPATSTVSGSTINEHVRATLIRCYRLATRWCWWRCEPVLGTMFDFFARRGLAQLYKEESRGSPKFLDELDRSPSLEVHLEDRSFSVFLKLLASGLRGMQKYEVYSEKKIGGIAWRFIPNHGRAYRKDAEVRQDELDALRNHHNLLCTLYFATPPAYRLRLDLIDGLVDHTTSHREACRLNVRAWSNLTAFQISTAEEVTRLEPFACWYKEMLSITISQYRLAKVEVEQDVAAANANSKTLVPQAVIENTIARNQQQIAATLIDALAAMKRAMQAASSAASARYLLERSNFWQVFDLFEPSGRRLYSMLDEALEVVKSALDVDKRFAAKDDSQNSSEESQDYGDSDALMELASGQQISEPADSTLVTVIHAPLAHLVSNVFGADESGDDTLSTKIIDMWTSAAQAMVSSGQRTIDNYISDYSSEAWTQLRDTEQRRKLTPYFFSRIVEAGTVDIMETGILRSWLASLVEREAMLKYQNRLTSTLLQCCSDEPLLRNLPFIRDASGQYTISLHDLRLRRVSLISSVLSNMRENFEKALYETRSSVQGLRRTYADLLKHLMQAMKSNYQDLQLSHQDDVANAQVQGAYVDFVQHIVSAMQQYTDEIQKIDHFFTDSAAFPLPATDPTYVVGKLRAYVPRLAETNKSKQLAVFVQTVSERAAVDTQQVYLVDQIATALVGTIERGDYRAPSLRHVLLTAVFPAYVEQALSTAFSWIVARPILQACGRVAGDLLYSTKFEDVNSVRGVSESLSALLQSMSKPLELAIRYPGQMRLPQAQSILAAIFHTAQQSLTCIQALQNVSGNSHLPAAMHRFDRFAERIATALTDPNDFDLIDIPHGVPETPCPWPETLGCSRRWIQEQLNDKWYAVDGQYYVKRGNGSLEVTVALGDEEEERQELLKSLGDFRESYSAIFKRHGRAMSKEGGGVRALLSDVVV